MHASFVALCLLVVNTALLISGIDRARAAKRARLMDGVDGAESKSEPVSSNEPVQLLVTMPDAKTRCLSVESKDWSIFTACDLLRCVGLGG